MRIFNWEQIIRLNYTVLYGNVYDLSSFLSLHPGGSYAIEKYYGKDATKVFEDVKHSKYARELMEEYFVGVLSEVDDSL